MKPQPPVSLPPIRSRSRTLRRRRRHAPRQDSEPWWADVRKFFGVSLFTYGLYDAIFRPVLEGLAGLLVQ